MPFSAVKFVAPPQESTLLRDSCSRALIKIMPHPWPDPRDPARPPSRPRDFLVYFTAAVIGAFMIVNLVRGIMGEGWNW